MDSELQTTASRSSIRADLNVGAIAIILCLAASAALIGFIAEWRYAPALIGPTVAVAAYGSWNGYRYLRRR